MSTKLYINFIQSTIKTEGYKVANIANKMALKCKRITIEQYCEAANLIVKAYPAA